MSRSLKIFKESIMINASTTTPTPVGPQNANTLIIHGEEQPVNESPEKTPEYFKNEALITIERLGVPRKTITELQSTLNLIMQKHHFDTSYLDELAKWFKHEGWFYEAEWALLLGAAAITVAYIPPLLAVLSGISITVTSLYCIAKFFLIDHYDKTSRRENRIKAHIANMEKHVLNAVTLLEDVEKQLNRMLISLCEINSQSAENLEKFEKQIAALNAQVPQFLATIAELEKLTSSLGHDNEIITAQLHNAMSEIEKSKTSIEQGQTMLGSITDSLVETNNDLTDVCDKFQSSFTSLDKLDEAFQEQLLLMKNRSTREEEILVQLSASTHETQVSQVNVCELLKKSDSALLIAEFALKQFDEDNAEKSDSAGFDSMPESDVDDTIRHANF